MQPGGKPPPIEMPTAFNRTLREVDADRFRPSLLALGAAGALLGAWCWWCLQGCITLYEVSPEARLNGSGDLRGAIPADRRRRQ